MRMKYLHFWSVFACLSASVVFSAPRKSQGVHPVFSHDLLTAALQDRVRKGRADYRALRSDTRFSRYLIQLKNAEPDRFKSREEQLAFWINAYNAAVIEGVLKRYPVKNLKDSPKFFTKEEHVIGGKTWSLDEIEKEALIGPFREPSLHFVLTDGATSSPLLPSKAYSVVRLYDELDAAAKSFLNDSSRNRYDLKKRTAHLSSLFKWHRDDFGGQEGVLDYISKYVSSDVKKMLHSDGLRVTYQQYDWSLNDLKR